MIKKIIVVGSGIAGATSARILHDQGFDVSVFETRSHIGGNCHDSLINGTLVHNYGPHIFHTNDDEVFNFLSRFTGWEPFHLKIIGDSKLGEISLPYSKKTISELGRELTQDEIVEFIFRDYSEKQWGIPFEKLPKSITNRIPKTRECDDPTWFEGQKYQCIPKYGYTEMFEKMLDGCDIYLNCGKDEWKNHKADLVIYTGKIDEYFDYRFGDLPYRTLDFVHETANIKLKNVIINQNNSWNSYTRIYDHSYFTKDHEGLTVITKEYPRECKSEDIPFYPKPFGEGMEIYSKYLELAKHEPNVIFLGRLATYTYMDMWMVVKQAILKLKHL